VWVVCTQSLCVVIVYARDEREANQALTNAHALSHSRTVADGGRGRCAGVYVWGVAGSNDCPANASRIPTEAACRIAAIATGEFGWSGSSADANFPRGCYSFGGFNWNPHTVGAGNAGARLLCIAPTGASPPAACQRCIYA
jgi:hypothetical protein